MKACRAQHDARKNITNNRRLAQAFKKYATYQCCQCDSSQACEIICSLVFHRIKLSTTRWIALFLEEGKLVTLLCRWLE